MFEFSLELTAREVLDGLPEKEQKIISSFEDYILISASKLRAEEGKREVLRFRKVTGKDITKITLEDLRYFLKELQGYDFADHTKNKIKTFIQRFLRFYFKDWSERFDEFRDIKVNNEPQNKKAITTKTLLTNDEVTLLLEKEPSLYWKTFLITQYEGALRTGEVRGLTWDKVDFEADGFTTLNIPCKKNRNGSTKVKPVVVKIAGKFLKELKKQQEKYDIKTKYVFPSPQDKNKPISKAVNLWFNNLCKKVLGREANNYLLRHSKGTELQKKVREGKLSKDNAVEFMRHSAKMFDKVYSHMDQEDIKQLIKKQIYNTKELSKAENDKIKELETEIEKLKKSFKSLCDARLENIEKVMEKRDPKQIVFSWNKIREAKKEIVK